VWIHQSQCFRKEVVEKLKRFIKKRRTSSGL
jgi:hypothetical protein